MMHKLFFLSLIIFISCQSNNNDTPIENETVKLTISNSDNDQILLSEVISNLEYKILKTPDDLLIGNVRKIISNKKYYGFLDLAKKSIWIFDKNLAFVNEILIPSGRGPEQLEYLSDISFGDNHNVYALGLYKILEFDLYTGFEREIRIQPQLYKFTYDSLNSNFIGYMNNSVSPHNTESDVSYNLVYINLNGEMVEKKLPIDQRISNLKFLHFDNFPSFNNEQLFFSYLDLNVYSLTNNEFNVKYSLEFETDGLNETILNKSENYSRNRDFLTNEIIDKEIARSIATFVETDSIIFCRGLVKHSI